MLIASLPFGHTVLAMIRVSSADSLMHLVPECYRGFFCESAKLHDQVMDFFVSYSFLLSSSSGYGIQSCILTNASSLLSLSRSWSVC